MNERKYTDEEVIKALKHCLKSFCLGCPRASNGWFAHKCADALYNDVVALINRQKMEGNDESQILLHGRMVGRVAQCTGIRRSEDKRLTPFLFF